MLIKKVKVWYLWRINKKKDVLHFLEEISPYLIEKKEQVELAKEFLEKYCEIKITCKAQEEYNILILLILKKEPSYMECS